MALKQKSLGSSLGPKDLLSHFPYPVPREIQKESLLEIQANWNNYDVFVLSAPTAYGKSSVAQTLINAHKSVSVITPTNLLVEQFRAEFPATRTLSRMDSYTCKEWRRPCPVTRAKLRNFCRGGVCSASKDLVQAKHGSGPGIYNYHTYLAHKIFRDVLVVDEAHNLIPHIRERMALTIWQHDYKYPRSMYSPSQMAEWIRSLPNNKQQHKKIQLLREAVNYEVPRYIVQRTTEKFNGKGTVRGQPEDRDCLKLLPVDISDAPPFFWPREVQKIVLLSATIGAKDIEALGLGRKRTLHISCASPIPIPNRPIVLDPVVSVNRNNMDQAAEQLANYINELADRHQGEKGLIHATYQMGGLLRRHLTGDRYIWHTRENKREQYQRFRDSDPADGKILVGSGLYEGIDLPEDMGRWQVLSKIPWQSLGNPAIAHLAKLDPDWFAWEAWKTIIQACGRISRTPEDYGITYIPDMSIDRLRQNHYNMVPAWWKDATTWNY